ncbi:MAG: cobalamin-dependent protein [Legionellales bacterium]|nr:cobalamin-dependent protein [Legionellales bacterium]
MQQATPYQPQHHIRVITATSLFDGHDAAINIMRRVIQDTGAEVIHLGHNRSVNEVVNAAIQEDVQAIAVSSYQGGHVEYFHYMMQLLQKANANIKVFGGGGGVIVPSEIEQIQKFGVSKIFSPEDGRHHGLQGMINELMRLSDFVPELNLDYTLKNIHYTQPGLLARALTTLELVHEGKAQLPASLQTLLNQDTHLQIPVIGLTGTGGAGKSSLADELVTRFLHDFQDKHIAILSVDPSRRRTGGALLGDRIRMNSLKNPRAFMRSFATRQVGCEISPALPDAIKLCQLAGFDLILVETAGIGQGDAAIVPLVDKTIYVMTAEYGAASQLEKIDMIDFANFIAINKYEHNGSEDALRAVRKQYQRNHKLFNDDLESMPVYGTIAAKFNDSGVTALYYDVIASLNKNTWQSHYSQPLSKVTNAKTVVIPSQSARYLADIAQTIRDYHQQVEKEAQLVEAVWQLENSLKLIGENQTLQQKLQQIQQQIHPESHQALTQFDKIAEDYQQKEFTYHVREKEFRVPLYHVSLSGLNIPKIALPRYRNPGDRLRWILKENVPGYFPYTAGVFPFRRNDEDPTRMFAGEGDAKRTNERFKFLSKNSPAKRLSTAFDSVTLYGEDPAKRPDIYGKVGTSGVSICTLEDMKLLYDGFDLCAPNNSVSMTINGPAPIILAFFLNTAIEQQAQLFIQQHNRQPNDQEYRELKAHALRNVRGTVQADILKEDQGQNTCIFAIDFALKMMGDIQEYFIEHQIRNFYSVSISGYHIAEAGANPISQAAFTLANGFTFVEYYLARGMNINEFAPNLSFFFSLSMDPEYAVINRVARRIWAIAMRDRYHADSRSQKLKAHIQTSGRSLHAQEIQFNDIRTTLEALTALYDNCNSLHTNSFDEAITTPTEESVRRALAIQLIINKEYGLYKNENATQGSFIIETLTDLVEEAILQEFERLSSRGGVLGAMELGYQRSKIQEESLYYERRKVSGEYPIVGVNTFINPDMDVHAETAKLELRRGTAEEKESQITRLEAFQTKHQAESSQALARLQKTVIENGNVFAELMETVKCCSLGQITQALFNVGGEYRRNM